MDLFYIYIYIYFLLLFKQLIHIVYILTIIIYILTYEINNNEIPFTV